jgi:hypothetical protein
MHQKNLKNPNKTEINRAVFKTGRICRKIQKTENKIKVTNYTLLATNGNIPLNFFIKYVEIWNSTLSEEPCSPDNDSALK